MECLRARKGPDESSQGFCDSWTNPWALWDDTFKHSETRHDACVTSCAGASLGGWPASICHAHILEDSHLHSQTGVFRFELLDTLFERTGLGSGIG